MILVGRYRSPFTRRVAISMRLLGLPYVHRPRIAFVHGDEIRALNPLTRVPVLVLDDGEALFDSTPILDYLDQSVGPARALVPPAEPQRHRVLRNVALAMGVMEKAVVVVYERMMRPPEKVHQPWIDRCEDQARSGLAALDAVDPASWHVERGITQAEITTAVMYEFLQTVNPGLIARGRYANLDALRDRCAALPAFLETQPEPG